ncbi:MAG: T9SS type A sorting domain-containing protein [Candidatus Eisenbacteria bacterium]|nr:T9SS type A sorting domain-containing protein [Candidatus Eisenbacteria bacterium]
MNSKSRISFRIAVRTLVVALALVAGALTGPSSSRAAASDFPSIKSWAIAGAFQDSSSLPGMFVYCVGALGVRPDSIRVESRAASLRFLRDRVAESRPDFGGYRIYRMINSPDTNYAVLVRRYSLNPGSELTWNFSVVDSATGRLICKNAVVHDSIVTFVDPDSNGSWQKVCRRRDSQGRCLSIGDSVFVLVAPPGPHDGFKTWYSITYEKKNTTDNDYEDLFLPDTLDNFARCSNPNDRLTCPNMNHKLRNLAGPVEPTGGPTANLERVGVVPNPYRGGEVWDPSGSSEVHFINLPPRATIKIYTVAGDLVREIRHTDSIRDFERWDLRSGANAQVASGIYIYRVESNEGGRDFSFQNRLVIIR